MPIEQTPKHQDLHIIANLADDQMSITHQTVAPHPRCSSGSVSAAGSAAM